MYIAKDEALPTYAMTHLACCDSKGFQRALCSNQVKDAMGSRQETLLTLPTSRSVVFLVEPLTVLTQTCFILMLSMLQRAGTFSPTTHLACFTSV